MFKLSIYEKVENKRGKSPDASRTRANLYTILFCLKFPFPFRTERTL